jgi:hypothetical protein
MAPLLEMTALRLKSQLYLLWVFMIFCLASESGDHSLLNVNFLKKDGDVPRSRAKKKNHGSSETAI